MSPRSQNRGKSTPSLRLMGVLTICVAAVLLALFLRLDPSDQAAAVSPQVAATPEALPTTEPTPEPPPTSDPTPTPGPDYTHPVPLGEAVDPDEWFADAVFIGDSRTDGLHLFSGITDKADFLYSTGITVFEVISDRKVIRQGDKKVSILEALGQKEYGKVYVSLGINELGGTTGEEFTQAYSQLIDAIREIQPNARLYIQSIIPVNTAKCKANNQRSYVTNENIYTLNSALAQLVIQKQVAFLDLAEVMADEYGEVPAELSADGVHFKKEGYQLWLDYLACHTGV